MEKYCPNCKKNVEVYVERTDPKGNGYQLWDAHLCSTEDCEYEFEGEATDMGELIDEAMSRNDN